MTYKKTWRTRALTLLGAAALLGACNEATGVSDLNNVAAEDIFAQGLTPTTAQLLVTGLLNRERGNEDIRFLTFVNTLSRDIFRIDNAEPRFVTETILGTTDPSGFVGGGVWSQFYYDIRTANIILQLTQQPTAQANFSAAQLSATRGFVRTMKAWDYWNLIATRDSLGIPINTDIDPTGTPAPILCKPSALKAIAALLDSAYADLQAGGTEFPFTLPAGFSSNGDFTTPAAFAKVNRGFAGRIELYRGLSRQSPDPSAFDRAIADLNASFLSTDPKDLDKGIYWTYSTAAGETQNPIADPAIVTNPQAVDSTRGGIWASDARRAKLVTIKEKKSGANAGVITTLAPAWTQSGDLTTPLPILKNQELVLLRAQAEIEKGDLAAARNDINYTHVNEGKLPEYAPFASKSEAIDAVLYEKRASLYLEGPQRLVDLRAYDRFNYTYIGNPSYDVTSKGANVFVNQSVLPIPNSEANARGNATACTQ